MHLTITVYSHLFGNCFLNYFCTVFGFTDNLTATIFNDMNYNPEWLW